MTQPTIDIDRPHEVITTGWWAESHAQFNLTLWGDLRMYMLGGTMTGESYLRLEFSPMIGMAGRPLISTEISLDFPLAIGMDGGGRSPAEFTAQVADPQVTMDSTNTSTAAFAIDLDPECAMQGQGVPNRALALLFDPTIDMAGSGHTLANFQLEIVEIDVAMIPNAAYSPAAFGLGFAPSMSMDSAPITVADFGLGLSIGMSMYSGSLAAADMSLDLAADVGIDMDAVGVSAAAFGLDLGDTAVIMVASDRYARDVALVLDPSVGMDGKPVAQLAFDLATPPTMSMQPTSTSRAAFTLDTSPVIGMDSASTSSAAMQLALPDVDMQFDTYLKYANAFTLDTPVDIDMLMERVVYQANMQVALDPAVGMETVARYARALQIPIPLALAMVGAGKLGALPADLRLDLASYLAVGMTGYGINAPVIDTLNSTAYVSPPGWWRNGVDMYDVLGLGGGAAGKGDVFGVWGFGGDGGSYATNSSSAALTGTGQLYAVVGAGGVGQTGSGAPANGAASTVRNGGPSGTLIISATGGTGNNNNGSGTALYGKSPGNRTYEGMTITGGAQVTGNGTNGNPPGGGGAGSGPYTTAGNGAAGRVMIRWRALGWTD